jgi:DNA-binding PucR family transcriptional regulator
MLLETVLTAPTDACELLVGLLDAVAEDARLMETLVVYLGCDLERTRTARALGLSRGGLARRLDRITHLSGYDPRTARGVQVLGAALAARALRDEGCG